MINTELKNSLAQNFDLIIPEKLSEEDLTDMLSNYINQLIQTDFEKLIFLMYKIDVDEKKLKQLLHQQPQNDAGKIIARLIIQRQQEKIAAKKQFRQTPDNASEEEKW